MVESANAGNCHESDNDVKANRIGRYAAEIGNTAAIKRFTVSHDIGESTAQLFKKCYRLHTRIMWWVWSNIACKTCSY